MFFLCKVELGTHTLIPQIIWKKKIYRLKIVFCSVSIKKKNLKFAFFFNK